MMIEAKLSQFETRQKTIAMGEIIKPNRRRQLRAHEFSFDIANELIRITGVDLCRLAGVGSSTALSLIAETGLDMSKWKNEKHFTSWLKLAANNKVSGGKVLQNKTKKKKPRAALLFRMTVQGLVRP